MIESRKVRDIVESYLQDTDYFLVDVEVDKNNSILVEVDSDENVPLEFCVELSRYIESKMDREVEDFELEVGSAGLTSPFKVLQQYQNHIGREVEVLTCEGSKLEGVLKEVTPENFTVTTMKKMKLEGAKRPKMVEQDLTFAYNEIKYTKYLISFK